MSTEDCLNALDAALADTHSKQEVDALKEQMFERLAARKAYLGTAAGGGLDEHAAAIEAARQLGNEAKMQSFIAKRNAALNLVKRTEHTEWVRKNFGSNFARGFESLLVGIQSAKAGTRGGAADVVQDMLRKQYLTEYGQAMRKAGVWDLHIKGDKAFDKDTFKAWYAFGDPNEKALLEGLNPQAVKAARIIADWTEHARLDANDAGAWIGKLDNWAGRQTHNAELIANAGPKQYIADLLQHADLPRMMAERGTVDQDKMLKSIYRTLASAVHETESNPLIGNVGTRNIGKGLSESRTVHFKSADDAWAYNQKYGGIYSPKLVWGATPGNTQSLAHSVTSQLQQMAQATGLMRIMGPNPQALLKSLITDSRAALKKAFGTADEAGARANLDLLNSREHNLDQFMRAVDGSDNQVGSAMKARIGQTARKLTQLMDLGQMLLSQFSDVAQHMSGSNYRGKGYMSGMHEAFSGLFTKLSDPENQRLAASLGVMIDNFLGEMARAGSFDVPGQTSKMLQWFYKVNGANWWNSHMRFAAAAGISNDFAQDVGKSFEQLHPGAQRVLQQYNIGPKEWDTIRAAELHEAKGEKYLLPENVADKKAADQWRTLITDQTTYSQLDPDAKTRAMMLGMLGSHQQAGTTGGEVARSVLLFKSFNAAFMQKTLGRELFGRGYEYDNASSSNVIGALIHGRGGEQAAIANIALIATAFGYGSLLAKDLAKGVAPQDPSKLTPTQRIELVMRAAQQGSGAGIYGDFLLGQANRSGGGFMDTVAGPVLGRVGGAADWLIKLRDEVDKGDVKPQVGADLYRGLESSIPGANLYYTRWALDYLINYRIQEALNPGHLQRVQNAMMKNSQQHFIVRPQTGSLIGH